MRLFTRNKQSVIKGSIFEDIPTPKPNELLAVPLDNRLWHPDVAIYQNNRKSPQWFKDVESGTGGLRRCYGLGDYMRTGYTIPLWAHLDVRPPISKLSNKWEARFDVTSANFDAGFINEEEHRRYFSEGALLDNQFEYTQTGVCPVSTVRSRKESTYVKLVNPWLLKTSPGYSSLFIQPQWQPNGDYTVLSGVVNTDYYHHCNVVLNITTDKHFEIQEGTPMLHVIPFKREDANKKASLIKGDEGFHKILDSLGFDDIFQRNDDNWKGAYKREQHRRDKDVQSSILPE
jgi:hypothetical protein